MKQRYGNPDTLAAAQLGWRYLLHGLYNFSYYNLGWEENPLFYNLNLKSGAERRKYTEDSLSQAVFWIGAADLDNQELWVYDNADVNR